jgi:hemerythrin-like domain-containing protein
MADHILLYKQGIKTSLTLIYEQMLGYAGLLKNHIQKENNVLFRMADKVLTTGEQESLLLKFEKTGINRENNNKKTDYEMMINTLESIYKI